MPMSTIPHYFCDRDQKDSGAEGGTKSSQPAKRIDAPPLVTVGGVRVRLWSRRDIARAKRVLASTRPGRKKKEN
jgi:hypothetical protein